MLKKSIIFLFFCLWATMAISQTAPCPEKILCVGETESIDCVPECIVEVFGSGTWSSSNVSVATVTAATSHTSVVTGVGSGTAIITYTVPVASGTAVFTTAVTVNPLPVAAPSYTFPVCEGGTLYLFANDGGGNTYAWTGPGGYSSTTQNPTRVSATSAMSGVYSLTVTTPAGCSAAYTLSVTISTSSAFTVSVNQISPFNLTGDNVHTYCTASFQLQAVTDPTLPGTGVTYTWVTAGSTYSTTTPVFTPTFTPTSTAVTKVYTLTVSYNGCTASTIETIIIPPSSCSPCDYFNVAKNRELSGLPALSGCSNCNVTQPFHTITSSVLSNTNVADGKNYYVIKDVWCRKTTLNNNNFFMNSGISMYVDVENDVDINHCHFFSTNTCWWRGIVVNNPAGGTGAAHLSVHGNTLIENCGGAGQTPSSYYSLQPSAILSTPTTYYNSSMADIVNSNGVIYNRNYYGIQLFGYKPTLSSASPTDRLPFTVKNSVFSTVFLGSLDAGSTAIANYPFSWPTAEALKTTVVFDVVPTFTLNSYTSSTLVNESQAGIILRDCGSSSLVSAGSTTIPAQYEYNYITIGDPTASANFNLFHSLYHDIQITQSNSKIINNKLIKSGNRSMVIENGINDVRVIGSRDGHTNNRFYNCRYGIEMKGISPYATTASHDFTCNEADFYNANDFMVGGVNSGIYILHNSGFNNYTVNDNVFYNHSTSVLYQNSSTVTLTSPSGTFDFYDNHLTGGSATTSGKIMEFGLYITDARLQANSNAMSLAENINVHNNYISGAYYAIVGAAYSPKFYINNNTIDMKFYASTYTPLRGIRLASSAHAKEIQRNVISGQAFGANNAHAISIENAGSVSNNFDISCNRVQNVKLGFDFRGTSVLQLTNNIINRCGIGMQINLNASIGTQGSVCSPADNKWVNESCSSCTTSFSGWSASGIYTTYMDGANSNLSPMYTRNDVVNYPSYIPVSNGAVGTGAVAYSWSSSLLNSSSLCSGGLSAPTGCETEGARSMTDGSGVIETEIAEVAADIMTVYPNPNDGDVTIKLTGNEAKTVNIKVINAVGVEVYKGQHKIDHDKTDLSLNKLPAGVYTIQVLDSKGENRTGKILKRQ